MKKNTILVLSLSCLAIACGVGFGFENGFGFTLVKGTGLVNNVLSLSGANIPISGEVFSSNQNIAIADEIRLDSLRIKGFKSSQIPKDAADAQEFAEDKDNYKHCSDAPDMSWFNEVELYIVDPQTDRRELLATWSKAENDGDGKDCVLTFEPNRDVNIRDYMPDFKVEVEASGIQPKEDTYLGGLIKVDVIL